jgi:hypothetical protein
MPHMDIERGGQAATPNKADLIHSLTSPWLNEIAGRERSHRGSTAILIVSWPPRQTNLHRLAPRQRQNLLKRHSIDLSPNVIGTDAG